MVYHYILKLTEYLRVCKSDRIRNMRRCMVDLISVENRKKMLYGHKNSLSLHRKRLNIWKEKLFTQYEKRHDFKLLKIPEWG